MLILNQIPSAAPIRIVIADEEPAFRKNLCGLLATQSGIEILGEANDAEGAAALMTQPVPHVLLLDYRISRKLQSRSIPNGADSTRAVRKIVMLSTPEKAYIIESFRLGAQGIVLKGSAEPIWQNSIAAVAAGQYWLGNESLAVLIQAICESPQSGSGPLPARYCGLTPREIEIIQKIADGRSNKEVGEDFSIRERTVKHHLTNIFGKVGVSSRLELALFARDHRVMLGVSPELVSAGVTPGVDRLQEEEVDLTDERPSRMTPRDRSELKRRAENA